MKEALRQADVQRLRALEVSQDPLKQDALNIWLFSLYANGMRCEDVLLLQWSDLADGTVTYQAYQTEVRRRIKISRTIQLLLDQYGHRRVISSYVFPYMDPANPAPLPQEPDKRLDVVIRQLNSRLAVLARKAGIDVTVTLHNARHTYARFIYEQTGDIDKVQQALGHRQRSTTLQYLRTIRGLEVPEDEPEA